MGNTRGLWIRHVLLTLDFLNIDEQMAAETLDYEGRLN